jgi:hypothetical protein
MPSCYAQRRPLTLYVSKIGAGYGLEYRDKNDHPFGFVQVEDDLETPRALIVTWAEAHRLRNDAALAAIVLQKIGERQ